MTFVFSIVFGRKHFSIFVYVSVLAENRITFSDPVTVAVDDVGRSLVYLVHSELFYVAELNL